MKARLDVNPEGRLCLRNRRFHTSIFLTTFSPEKRCTVLLGDNSGSTIFPYQRKGAIEWEKDFFKEYLMAVSSKPGSLVGIISFNHLINLHVDSENGSFETKKALIYGPDYDAVFVTLIEKYRDKFFREPDDPRNHHIIDSFRPWGLTAGGGAVYTAINFLGAVENVKNKQIIVVSDGFFNVGLGSLVRERGVPESDVKKIDIEFIEGLSEYCEQKNIHPTLIFIPAIAQRYTLYATAPEVNIKKLEETMKELVIAGKNLRKNSPSIQLHTSEAIQKLQKGFGEYGAFIAVPSMEYLPSLARDLSTCATHPVGYVDLRVKVDGGQIERIYSQGEVVDMYGKTSYEHHDRLIGIRNFGMELRPEKNMKIRVEAEYKKGKSTKRIRNEKKVNMVDDRKQYVSKLNPLSRVLHGSDEFGKLAFGAGMFLDTMIPYLYSSGY